MHGRVVDLSLGSGLVEEFLDLFKEEALLEFLHGEEYVSSGDDDDDVRDIFGRFVVGWLDGVVL